MPVNKFDDTEPGKHLQAARDMLTFHGIDPSKVLDINLTTEGYVTMRTESMGEGLPDGVYLDNHAWPINFPVKSFFEHIWAWRGAIK